MSSSEHDASASALGYLHQVQFALLQLVAVGRRRPDHALRIEAVDDVSWHLGEEPVEVIQLKHHLSSSAELTDFSPDLWRTVKVWLDNPSLMHVDGPDLLLVTTSAAATSSAAALLCESDRDEDAALVKLDAAAAASENTATERARQAWLDASATDRRGLVHRVTVYDSSFHIEDFARRLRDELFFVIPDDNWPAFERLLLGWWYKVAVDLLTRRRRSVSALDVQRSIEAIRDQFTAPNLPRTATSPLASDIPGILSSHQGQRFVKQLGWIEAPLKIVDRTIIDFHRTVTQTTDWVDSQLIDMAELDEYRDKLAEQWEYAYEAMNRRLPADATETAKRDAGFQLFDELRLHSGPYLRDGYDEPFYRNGVHCELANTDEYGWHPDFVSLVKQLTIDAA